MCADLNEQLHGRSIDTIDDNDGCIVRLEKFEQHAVGDDVAAIATHPLIIANRHERGVAIAVGINDGTGLEIAKISRFCDGDFVAFHGVLTFLSELDDFEFTDQLVREEFDHLFHVLLDTGVTNPVARFAVFED